MKKIFHSPLAYLLMMCSALCVLWTASASARECGLPNQLIAYEYQKASETTQQTLLALMSKMTYQQSKESFGADFKYGPYAVNANKDNFEAFQESLKTTDYSNTFATRSSEIISSQGDATLLKAYEACIGTLPPVRAKVDERVRIIDITFEYMPASTENRPTRIKSVTYFGADNKGESTCINQIEAHSSCIITLQMPNDADQEVVVTIDTDAGPASAYIPPRRSFVFRQNKPIPQKYSGGNDTKGRTVQIEVQGQTPGTAQGCTDSDLPPNTYIQVINPSIPAVIAAAHPDYQGMVTSNAKLNGTPDGLQKRVCFQYTCQWPGNQTDGGRSCIGYLNGNLTETGWEKRY
jgi:hypothetical protein